MTTQTLPDNRRAIMAIIMASYLMILIDVSIVITGLPKIQAGLGFSTVGLSWVQNAYTLALGGLLLLGARAGDILGRRRMLLLGLAIFTLSSLAIGLAQTPAWLLAARAVQGAGSAILAPATLALLSTHFAEGPERTRALSLYAATAGIGATLGLVLGGLFAELLSWRAGFFINLPIGALLMLATRRYIQETPTHSGQLDIGGAASSTLGMTALVYGLVRAAEQGWGDWLTITALTGGLGLLGIFLLIQARARQPILPLRLFASRERSGAYAARMLFLGGMVGFWFFTTQFLQGVLGFTPLQAGLAFLPATLPNFLSAMLVPRLTPRVGSARLLAFGLPGLPWRIDLAGAGVGRYALRQWRCPAHDADRLWPGRGAAAAYRVCRCGCCPAGRRCGVGASERGSPAWWRHRPGRAGGGVCRRSAGTAGRCATAGTSHCHGDGWQRRDVIAGSAGLLGADPAGACPQAGAGGHAGCHWPGSGRQITSEKEYRHADNHIE